MLKYGHAFQAAQKKKQNKKNKAALQQVPESTDEREERLLVVEKRENLKIPTAADTGAPAVKVWRLYGLFYEGRFVHFFTTSSE